MEENNFMVLEVISVSTLLFRWSKWAQRIKYWQRVFKTLFLVVCAHRSIEVSKNGSKDGLALWNLDRLYMEVQNCVGMFRWADLNSRRTSAWDQFILGFITLDGEKNRKLLHLPSYIPFISFWIKDSLPESRSEYYSASWFNSNNK